MKNEPKHILVCGSPYFENRDAIQIILKERIQYGNIVYTFRRDGACHIAEIWLRSCHIPCVALPLPDSIPKRRALILELISIVNEVILFGDGDDISYIFRLAKLAKRIIYVCGKENLTWQKETGKFFAK